MLRTAGEGWRVGASCTVREWRDGWAGYAELGAIASHAAPDLNAPVEAEQWSAMERSLPDGHLEAASAHPALEATSALVRKMLVQTGRHHVARAPDERTLCALEIPARLWRALRDAGPCPEPPAPLDLTDRWWLVEIEEPADDEPNLVALWEEDGEAVTLATFLGVDDGAGGACPTVVSWRIGAGGRRSRTGVAVLRYPVHVDDTGDAERQASARLVIDTLAAPDTGTMARVRSAIALHLAEAEPTALGPYRASTAGAQTPREAARERRGSFSNAGRVSVGDDDRGCVVGQRSPHHDAGMDGGAVDRAAEQLLARDRPVAVVEEDRQKGFVALTAKARFEVTPGERRRGEGVGASQPGLHPASVKLEDGVDARPVLDGQDDGAERVVGVVED